MISVQLECIKSTSITFLNIYSDMETLTYIFFLDDWYTLTELKRHVSFVSFLLRNVFDGARARAYLQPISKTYISHNLNKQSPDHMSPEHSCTHTCILEHPFIYFGNVVV